MGANLHRANAICNIALCRLKNEYCMRSYSFVWSLTVVLSLLLFGGCKTTRKIAGQAIGWMPWSSRAAPSKPSPEREVRAHGLAVTVRIEPFPVKLSDTRRVNTVIRLKNVSSRFIPLEFPTTQRFDVLVRDEASKLLVQWSDDQSFEAMPAYVGINPGEHVEYVGVFSTRDLLPGKRYTASVVFPGREDLKTELAFVTER